MSVAPDEMRLDYAVHLDGVVVDRERAEGWKEGDPMREWVLDYLSRQPDLKGEMLFTENPTRASAVAAQLKRLAPEELVTIVLWPTEE